MIFGIFLLLFFIGTFAEEPALILLVIAFLIIVAFPQILIAIAALIIGFMWYVFLKMLHDEKQKELDEKWNLPLKPIED